MKRRLVFDPEKGKSEDMMVMSHQEYRELQDLWSVDKNYPIAFLSFWNNVKMLKVLVLDWED